LRTANAILPEAFRHLRYCDAALQDRRDGGGLSQHSLHWTNSPIGMAEIGSNAGIRITMMCAARLFSFDADQVAACPAAPLPDVQV
jgi:hypothetical protein